MVISQPQSPNARKNSKFVFLIFYFEYLCYTVTYQKIICSQSSQKYFFFKIFPKIFPQNFSPFFPKIFLLFFKMIKNSRNIFILLFIGIFRFFKIAIFWIFSLLFFWKINTMQQNLDKNFPFLEEMLEKWPARFFAFPTAIRLGRAIFSPILFLFSQKNVSSKNDKNS